MTLDALVASLPWGLHHAYLETPSVDWPRATASLVVRVMISERQDRERTARIDLSGLVFCAMDPPELAPARGYSPTPAQGLWIDAGPGAAPEAAAALPPVPGAASSTGSSCRTGTDSSTSARTAPWTG